ncbi:MAG: pitrilysin family protein [Myxococcota bacterium]
MNRAISMGAMWMGVMWMGAMWVGLSGCGPKNVPPQTRTYTEMPSPLAPRPFQLPAVVAGELSNGIQIAVVENHEVPLVYVRLVSENGAWTDPADRPGLASATVDMLNEGAAGKTADQISRELRALASELTSGSGLDGATVNLKTLKENLTPSLDLMAQVTLQPDFPEAEWSIIRANRIQTLKAVPQDPRQIARRAWSRMMYGEAYAGNLTTIDSYEAMTRAEMQTWYADHFVAEDLTFLVGGDITLEEIQPLLEARFGEAFQATGGETTAAVTPDAAPVDAGTIYLVDKPGATQSLIRMGQFVGERTAEDATALELANMAIGGQFTSRINLNLREDKGWTYGASSWISYNYLPGVWNVYTSVQTPYTADAITEMWGELEGALGETPLTQGELAAARGDVLGSWPVRFENPGYLLDRTVDVQRYALPKDWLSSYPDRIRAVSLADARAALQANINPEALVVLVIGDVDVVRPALEGLGWPIVEMNPDGTPVAPND